MIVLLSYIIAILLTMALAILLYPVAALFWLLGIVGRVLVVLFNLFGKLSDHVFKFTTKVIRHLWKDIRNIEKQPIPTAFATTWVCTCGTTNSGNFCSACGGAKIIELEPEPPKEAIADSVSSVATAEPECTEETTNEADC